MQTVPRQRLGKHTSAQAMTSHSNTAAVFSLCPLSLRMLNDVAQQNMGCVYCVVRAELI
jgi:hypothetical protein